MSALEIVGSLNTEGGFAIAIKFGKMFAVKQKEAALLSSEKEQLKATFDSRVYDEVKLNCFYSSHSSKRMAFFIVEFLKIPFAQCLRHHFDCEYV